MVFIRQSSSTTSVNASFPNNYYCELTKRAQQKPIGSQSLVGAMLKSLAHLCEVRSSLFTTLHANHSQRSNLTKMSCVCHQALTFLPYMKTIIVVAHKAREMPPMVLKTFLGPHFPSHSLRKTLSRLAIDLLLESVQYLWTYKRIRRT